MKVVFGLTLVVLSTLTYAQKTPLACQVDASAGLKWEGGKWNTRTFNEAKFLLVREGKTLTTDSVAKVLEINPGNVTCHEYFYIACHDTLGGSVFFSPVTSKGAISRVLGSTMVDNVNYKDTVTVEAFTCIPF